VVTESATVASGLVIYDYAMIGYFVAYVLYAAHAFWLRQRAVGIAAAIVLALTWVVHTLFFVQRAIFYYHQHQGFVLPATNMFEAISFFAWLIVLLYLIGEFVIKTRIFGVLGMIVPIAALASTAAGINTDPREIMPALKSYWLVFHIVSVFIGYAAFASAFSLAIMYLLNARRDHALKRIDPRFNLQFLDDWSYRMVLLGFPMLTLGIFLGAVWADSAWGRYWGWDPKETWALITWFIYLAFIHLRIHWRWVGYRSALFNIIGFASVLITFIGVNLLDRVFKLNSIHAYAEGGGTFMLVLLGLAVLIPTVLYFLPTPKEEAAPVEDQLSEFTLASEVAADDAEENQA